MRTRGGNHFVRRGTPIRRGATSSVNRGGFQKSRVTLYTSSTSESYDINDDIPMINETPVKREKNAAALLSSESYYESDDNYNQEILINNNDLEDSTKFTNTNKSVSDLNNNQHHKSSWKPSNTPNPRKISNPSHGANNTNTSATFTTPPTSTQNKVDQKSDPYESYEYEEESNSNTNNAKNELNSNHSVHLQKNQDNPPENNQNENQKSSNIELTEISSIKTATSNDFEQYIAKNNPTPTAPPNTPPTTPLVNKTEPDLINQTLTFLREKGSLLKKETFRFLENHQVIYYSADGKDHMGHYTIISSQPSCIIGEIGYKGLVRQNSKGTKFLYVSNETKPHDDRESEVCGIYLKNQSVGRKFKVTVLSLAIIADKSPYFSISKRLSLTSLASGETESIPNTIKFTSKIPEVNEKGKLTLNLGDVFLVPSSKNIVICNENNEVIFSFIKINNGSFSVHCAPPIDPLMAFAISISIVKGF